MLLYITRYHLAQGRFWDIVGYANVVQNYSRSSYGLLLFYKLHVSILFWYSPINTGHRKISKLYGYIGINRSLVFTGIKRKKSKNTGIRYSPATGNLRYTKKTPPALVDIPTRIIIFEFWGKTCVGPLETICGPHRNSTSGDLAWGPSQRRYIDIFPTTVRVDPRYLWRGPRRWLGGKTACCWPRTTTCPGRRWTRSGPCTWTCWPSATPATTRASRTANGLKRCWWSSGSRRCSGPKRTAGTCTTCATCFRCSRSSSARDFTTLAWTAAGSWGSPTPTPWRPKSPPFTWVGKYGSAVECQREP